MKALKYDTGKLPWDLLPFKAIEGMLRILLYGKRKYSICKECGSDWFVNPRLDSGEDDSGCPNCESTECLSGAHNWRNGFVWSRLVASSFRHLAAIAKGEFVDQESGEFHVFHLLCCAAFLAEHMTEGYGENDLHMYSDR